MTRYLCCNRSKKELRKEFYDAQLFIHQLDKYNYNPFFSKLQALLILFLNKRPLIFTLYCARQITELVTHWAYCFENPVCSVQVQHANKESI